MPEHPYLWHPILVHFTVGLLATSAVFFAAAWMPMRVAWRGRVVIAAELTLWTGTALTDTVPHDDAVHDIMVSHRNLALITFAGFAAMAAISIGQRKRAGYPSLLFVLGMLAAVAALVATGLLGGRLVFEYGLAVEKRVEIPPAARPAERPAAAPVTPQAEGHAHPHHEHR